MRPPLAHLKLIKRHMLGAYKGMHLGHGFQAILEQIHNFPFKAHLNNHLIQVSIWV